MNATIIFLILLVLMLTGMPISISLGLTVLSFLFMFTQVPLESVALKLFTGIEKFEIMAIPFFILAGNFLTHGGVAKRMILRLVDGRATGTAVLVSPVWWLVRCSLRFPVPPRRPWWRLARSCCRRWSRPAFRTSSGLASSRPRGRSVS
jgi:hypothetical protein